MCLLLNSLFLLVFLYIFWCIFLFYHTTPLHSTPLHYTVILLSLSRCMLWIERLKWSGYGWRGGGKELIGIHVGENIQNILCEKKCFFFHQRGKYEYLPGCMCVYHLMAMSWGDGSDVKSIYCSCRGLGFSSQYFHENSQPTTLVPASQTPYSAFLRPLSHTCTHIDVGSHTRLKMSF